MDWVVLLYSGPLRHPYLDLPKPSRRDTTGALASQKLSVIKESAEAKEAQALIRNGPFCQNQVFISWLIRPWNIVTANREPFPA
jgi:hypothetical protein